MDMEEALVYLLGHTDFFGLSMIASTWMQAGDTVIFRFESLIEDPHTWFRAIVTECGLDIPDDRLANALDAWSFEKLAGRPRGEEGQSHYRRGEAGDWRRHFTERVSWEFATRFDDLLVKCGYEPTLT